MWFLQQHCRVRARAGELPRAAMGAGCRGHHADRLHRRQHRNEGLAQGEGARYDGGAGPLPGPGDLPRPDRLGSLREIPGAQR